MLKFILAISCVTTSGLPWFMDLTFQVPMQYCSLQHGTLLLSPVTSTTGYCSCFGSIPSFFLELFLHWSPVAYWAPTDLGSSSFSIPSFCLLIMFMGFSRQEYWSGLPFPSPVDHTCKWIFRLSPCFCYYKQCHYEHKVCLCVCIYIYISFWIIVLFWYMPRSGSARSYGSSIFGFLRIPLLFPVVAAPTYIPTNSVEGFPFLHTLSSFVI